MKKLLFTAAVWMLAMTVHGQFVYDYLNAANKYFEKGDYYSAAQYYEKYFNTGKTGGRQEFSPYTPQTVSAKTTAKPTNQEVGIWRIAESYRMLNYPAKAEPYYRQALEIGADKFPQAAYYLGTMLRALERYEEAEATFKNFIGTYTSEDAYRKEAQREIVNLQFIQAQLKKKDIKYYTLTKAPADLNTLGGSYAPVWVNNSSLYFTSTRPADSSEKKKDYTNKIYEAAFTETGITGVTKVNITQPRDVEQGVTAATPDGQTLFITRWTGTGAKKQAAIYSSVKNANGWSEPQKLDASVNEAGSSSQEPFVTADGKYLFFSSNRAGGKGGFDIWYAELDATGKPGVPVNAGDQVNTSYDDQAPYYHEPSKALVFSSKGRVGMGGFDFFQSKGAIGQFEEAQNLGYPVNSVKDDIYLVSKGGPKNMLEKILLSSDRDAACCLELFYLQKIRPLRQISGKVVSCDGSKQLPGATLAVIDTVSNTTVYNATIGADGTYHFTLEDYQPLKVEASAPGFLTNSIRMQVPADIEEEGITNPVLCLLPEPPKVNESFIVRNVYYEYDKSEVKPESYPALDELVRMMETYPELEIEISAHTDSKGTDKYNQKLSEARARSVVAYLVAKGVAESRLKSKGYGEAQPIAPNTNPDGSDNPDGREQNRRTEFKVLKN